MKIIGNLLSKASFVLVLLVFICPLTHADPLQPGRGDFSFRNAATGSKSVKVWYFKPDKLAPDAKVVFVMPGVKRNGQDYREEWVRHAKKYHFLLLVPEFSEQAFPKDAYQFGGVTNPDHKLWTFSVIEGLFDLAREKEGLSTQKYILFGHSAGAQFVHRFMLFMASPRVELAIAANAGSYTLPVYSGHGVADFPWSLDAKAVSETQLKANFAEPLVLMLGGDDTDPNHKMLPREPEAMAEGPDRMARGQKFYAMAKQQAQAMSAAFNWKFVTVPGVGHSDVGMSAAAMKYVFEH
jgi:poly(3-hydroxybutyrate) depolymerase